MKLHIYSWVLALAITPLLFISTANAGSSPQSSIVQMKVLTPNHAKHDLYHGVIWLDADKSKHTYRWGGKNCGDKGLDSSFVDLIFDAFKAKHNVTLHYVDHAYNTRNYRCITDVTVSRS